jgi:hypothetical protein
MFYAELPQYVNNILGYSATLGAVFLQVSLLSRWIKP